MRTVEPTSGAGWVRTIVRAIDARGHDGKALAERAGIDRAQLEQPEGRIPQAAVRRLWQAAIEITGDPAFGLGAWRALGDATFHGLVYAVLASPTLEAALRRLIRFYPLATDHAVLSLECDAERGTLVTSSTFDPESGGPGIDASMMMVAKMARRIHHGGDIAPLRVRLRRATPASPEVWTRAFHAPVEFGAAVDTIEYSLADLRRPAPEANAELALRLDEVVARELSSIDHGRLTDRLHAALVQTLPDGPPSEKALARRLGMSTRRMQQELASEGTSYRAVLGETRARLGREYLSARKYSVTEIALLLGFADSATFSRAFSRWTGVSPRIFRERSAAGGWP